MHNCRYFLARTTNHRYNRHCHHVPQPPVTLRQLAIAIAAATTATYHTHHSNNYSAPKATLIPANPTITICIMTAATDPAQLHYID
jgi:hypothetical protein